MFYLLVSHDGLSACASAPHTLLQEGVPVPIRFLLIRSRIFLFTW